MTRQDKIRKAVNAVKAGAGDYLTYPLDAEELKLVSENLNKIIERMSMPPAEPKDFKIMPPPTPERIPAKIAASILSWQSF